VAEPDETREDKITSTLAPTAGPQDEVMDQDESTPITKTGQVNLASFLKVEKII
jgi:hypothetical protein